MKLLLDECVPRRLRTYLPGHVVQTTQEAECAGFKNGALINQASHSFEALITVDRNLAFQQNPKTLPIPVIIIHSKSNKLADLKVFVDEINALLETKLENRLYHVGV